MTEQAQQPKYKEHFLKTIQDIYDVVDENNIDFFLVDFKIFMVECVKAKMLNRIASEMAGEKDEGLILENFHWLEDGKHENNGATISSPDGEIILNVTELLNRIKL